MYSLPRDNAGKEWVRGNIHLPKPGRFGGYASLISVGRVFNREQLLKHIRTNTDPEKMAPTIRKVAIVTGAAVCLPKV